MQDEQIYGTLTWDDISNLPMPDEVKPLITQTDWTKFEWYAMGLPWDEAAYNVVGGKSLYLAELPNGTIKVLKLSEFTGNIVIGGYFVNEIDPEGFNYFVSFSVTILRGEVIEVTLYQLNKQPVLEYHKAADDFNKNIKRLIKITKSWWFKYLYRPYYLVVRGAGAGCLHLLHFVRVCIIKTVIFLTPL